MNTEDKNISTNCWKLKEGCEGKFLNEIFLSNLDVKSTDEINQWFIDSYNDNYPISGLEELKEILDTNPELVVYIEGDFDVDGRCATVILVGGLSDYGRIVKYRVPKRISEGFGLNMNMINEITEEKAIIITCDNGIAAHEAIAEAKRRGHIVIITDHHLSTIENGKAVYPDADIIIDPNAFPESAKFQGYCGAGIAYKIVRYLLGKQRAKIYESLVAIATVCDSVPLRKENYVFVRNGLKKIEKRIAPVGVLALVDVMRVESLTSHNVGFKIGPPINAPGRLYDEDGITLPLLMTDDYKFAKILAEQVKEVNEMRKTVKSAGLKDALEYIEENHLENDSMLVIYIHVPEGIVGILAGELSSKYKRPCLVFTDNTSDDQLQVLLKGSARSVDYIDIKAVLDENAQYIYKYGGHPGAAGVTILKKDFNEFKNALNKTVDKLLRKSEVNVQEYVKEIDNSEVKEVLDEQELYEPFGEANPRPIYKIKNFRVIPQKGKYKHKLSSNGIKFYSSSCEAVGFGIDSIFENVDSPKRLTIYGTLSYNVFRGVKKPQINILDCEIVEDEDTEFAKRLKAIGS